MKVIPAVDVRGNRCVRLFQGEPGREFSYETGPAEWAGQLVRSGASNLHIVDLGAAFGEPPSTEAIKAILERVRVPVQVGGGIRSLDRIRELCSLGADRLILGTAALENRSLLQQAVAGHGPKRIVVALDLRSGEVGLRGWRETKRFDLKETGGFFRSLGLQTLLVTAIDRDGTFGGPDVELWRRVAQETGMNVIGAGGFGSREHLRDVADLRFPALEGVVIGRALFEGRIDLTEAIDLLEEGS